MSKFTKSAAKKSLMESLSLLEKDTDFIWAEFHEIKDLYLNGYRLVNEDKRNLFEGKKK